MCCGFHLGAKTQILIGKQASLGSQTEKQSFNYYAANDGSELILLKNSCLIEVLFADSILVLDGRIDDDGTEAGSAGGAVL